jgi:hypothetical protein
MYNIFAFDWSYSGKTMDKLSQNSTYPGRDSKQAPLEDTCTTTSACATENALRMQYRARDFGCKDSHVSRDER